MSDIEWTDVVWNPVTGCTRASRGCDNCYAVVMTRRLAGYGHPKYQGLVNAGKGHFNGVVRTHEDVLLKPLQWKQPTQIFVNSMSDLFHKAVPFEFIDLVFVIMALAHRHTFMVLTKRADRMAEYMNGLTSASGGPDPDRWDTARQTVRRMLIREAGPLPEGKRKRQLEHAAEFVGIILAVPTWPLSNVRMGVSVEDQAAADERIPDLLRTPAAVRFLSCEPLLGPLELGLLGTVPREISEPYTVVADLLQWVIVGGESGPGARPCDLAWIRDVVAQCRAARVPVFTKQVGSVLSRELGSPDAKGGRMEDWPEDIRIREFPNAA